MKIIKKLWKSFEISISSFILLHTLPDDYIRLWMTITVTTTIYSKIRNVIVNRHAFCMFQTTIVICQLTSLRRNVKCSVTWRFLGYDIFHLYTLQLGAKRRKKEKSHLWFGVPARQCPGNQGTKPANYNVIKRDEKCLSLMHKTSSNSVSVKKYV